MNKRKQIEKKYDIKQLPNNGLWWCRVNGKLARRTSKDDLIDYLISLESGVLLRENTIEGILPGYLEYRRLSKSDGTYRQDIRYINNYIKNHPISKIPIEKITFADGVEWAQDVLRIRGNMTSKYWKNVKGSLVNILHYADCFTLDKLNIHQDKLVRYEHDDSIRIFSSEEKAAVKDLAFKEAAAKKNSLPLAIPLLFNTGLRTGELCALKWKDVSPSFINVHAEMIEDSDDEGNFTGYKYVDHTKTKAGMRKVPINKELSKILLLIKEYNLGKGIPSSPDSFIFLRLRKGEYLPPSTRCFDARLRRYCKEAGMENLKSQHDIRRTFATDLFYVGMNLKDIQKVMGHSSISQTEEYIYHKETGDAKDFLNAINA